MYKPSCSAAQPYRRHRGGRGAFFSSAARAGPRPTIGTTVPWMQADAELGGERWLAPAAGCRWDAAAGPPRPPACGGFECTLGDGFVRMFAGMNGPVAGIRELVDDPIPRHGRLPGSDELLVDRECLRDPRSQPEQALALDARQTMRPQPCRQSSIEGDLHRRARVDDAQAVLARVHRLRRSSATSENGGARQGAPPRAVDICDSRFLVCSFPMIPLGFCG
jgi:hypothetical protein